MNLKHKSTLEKADKKLRFRNYADSSIRTYLNYMKLFLSEFDKDVYHISVREAEKWLIEYPYSSRSQQNQIISAVKFLYLEVVGRKLNTLNIKRPRKEKKLPRVVDAELLATKIRKINNLKHRAILSLGLSCGLRISEVVNLKWKHLDRERNLLKVVNSKGNKDRYVHLNEEMILLLENYWRLFKSKDHVFNGQFSNKYSTSSIQKIVKKHIHPKATYHVLRHSFATYSVEQGNDISILAKAMGHSSIKTTQVYTHISNKSLKTIKTAI